MSDNEIIKRLIARKEVVITSQKKLQNSLMQIDQQREQVVQNIHAHTGALMEINTLINQEQELLDKVSDKMPPVQNDIPTSDMVN